MPTFTVQKLIDRAKAAADMHDDFVTPSQWIDWLNVEILSLERFIAQSGYVLRESQEIVSADGNSVYELQKEPLAVLAVFEDVDGRFRRLRGEDVIDGQNLRDYADSGRATKFRVSSSADGTLFLGLYPAPQAGQTYRVSMIEVPPTVAATTDTVSYPLGWEERLVLGLARRALSKEETVNPGVESEIRRIEEHIEETAWNRLFANSGARVRNVDRVERGWLDSPEVPPRDYWVFL